MFTNSLSCMGGNGFVELPYSGKICRFQIWRICPKTHLAVFKFGGSAPYNDYCTMNLLLSAWLHAKDCERATMHVFSIDSCVRGHHVYKDIWSPTAGEELACARENSNTKDPYAVAVTRDSTVVGHVPRKLSAACALFLRTQGTIVCTVMGTRRFSDDLPQGGLEVPCLLMFRGQPTSVAKVKRLVLALCKPPSLGMKQSNKKRKVVCDVVQEHTSPFPRKAWLTLKKCKLTDVDRATIISGGKLTDEHISFAQTILQMQFNDLLGLESTLLLHKHTNSPLPTNATSLVVQIIHSLWNHWIVATTILWSTRMVRVYDSIYSNVDQATMNILANLFGDNCNVEMGESPKQQGRADCGVFAIATATSLAHDKTPGRFRQEAMDSTCWTALSTLLFLCFPVRHGLPCAKNQCSM